MALQCEITRAVVGALLLAGAGFAGGADAPAAEPPRRAKPPVWSRDVLDAFFEDARDQLVGARPENGGAARVRSGGSPGDASPADPNEFHWSALIDGETLSTEVKHVVARLGEPLANPGKFKAGGFKECRSEFSLLAVLFAVIAEHDGDVRWQSDAPALRERLARAGRNCKTATDLSFQEAAERKLELADIVRGQRLTDDDAAPLAAWSELADRSLLMRRMETALQQRVQPKLASAAEFRKARDEVQHEAEMLAMLAEVIQRENFDYWDDDTFREYSGELRAASRDLARAAADENYDAARQAVGRASQACSNCHEGYRG